MTDKPNKNNKGKSLNPNEVSELLRNFYQPNQSGIQDFDEFYAQLEKKIESSRPEAVSESKLDKITEDYKKREEQLQKMLADIDVSGRTKVKRSTERFLRLIVVLLISAMLVIAGVFTYGYLHHPKANSKTAKAVVNPELKRIESEWETYKIKQLAAIEELELKFNQEMQKSNPDAELISKLERDVLAAKAELRQAKTKMLLDKKRYY